MPEPVSHTSIFTWIVGALASIVSTIFGFLFKRQINRLDDHDRRIAGMEKDWVEAEHFQESINRIELGQNKIHERVDKIWEHLAKGKQ